MKFARNHWPLILAILALWATLGTLLSQSLAVNDGNLVYALDDPYIHMAIARNFTQHGVWGATRYSFSSSTSSLTWPLLLALDYRLLGVNQVSPFVLNLLIATGLLFAVSAFWARYAVPKPLIAIGLLAITFFAPLPALVFAGLEHILHSLLVIAVVCLSARMLSEKQGDQRRSPVPALSLLVPLLTATRYESLSILLIICLLLALRGKPVYALMFGALGFMPIAIYGAISMSKGWFFLPNSVMLKTNSLSPLSLKNIGACLTCLEQQAVGQPSLLLMILAAGILFYLLYGRQKVFWREPSLMLVILIGAGIIHLAASPLNWFYRYEAYLIVLGLFAVIPAINEYAPLRLSVSKGESAWVKYSALALIIIVACLPLLDRGIGSLPRTVTATHNIYDQQYQMARFAREFYSGRVIGANDIGAINYFADIRCLDLWGLANKDVAVARKSFAFGSDTISEMAAESDMKVAMIYEQLFPKLPADWVKVGEWTIRDPVVCEKTVSFYAVGQREAVDLRDNLQAYSNKLPSDVIQSGEYTQ